MKKLIFYILILFLSGCGSAVRSQTFANPSIYDSVSSLNNKDLFMLRDKNGVTSIVSFWRLNQSLTGGGGNYAGLNTDNTFSGKNTFNGSLLIPTSASTWDRSIWLTDTIMYYRAWDPAQLIYRNFVIATRDWVANNFSGGGSGTGSYATLDGENHFTGRNEFKNDVFIDGSAGAMLRLPRYSGNLSLIDGNVGGLYWLPDETISIILKLSDNSIVRRGIATREWVQAQNYASSSNFVDLNSDQEIYGAKAFLGSIDNEKGWFLLRGQFGSQSPNISQKFKFYYNQQLDQLEYIDSVWGQTDVYSRRGFPSYAKVISSIDSTLNTKTVALNAGDTINMIGEGTVVYTFDIASSGIDTLYINSSGITVSRVVQLLIEDYGLGGRVVFRKAGNTTYIYSQNGGEAYVPSSGGYDVLSLMSAYFNGSNAVFLSWVKNYSFMKDPGIE